MARRRRRRPPGRAPRAGRGGAGRAPARGRRRAPTCPRDHEVGTQRPLPVVGRRFRVRLGPARPGPRGQVAVPVLHRRRQPGQLVQRLGDAGRPGPGHRDLRAGARAPACPVAGWPPSPAGPCSRRPAPWRCGAPRRAAGRWTRPRRSAGPRPGPGTARRWPARARRRRSCARGGPRGCASGTPTAQLAVRDGHRAAGRPGASAAGRAAPGARRRAQGAPVHQASPSAK